MTKLEIMSNVIELSGRFDLIEEMNEGQTKGDLFLDAALKFLDITQQTPESKKNLVRDIHRTQYKLAFENARAVRELWIDTGDGEKLLTKVSLKEMNQQYPEKMFQDGEMESVGDIVFNSDGTIHNATHNFKDFGFSKGNYIKITGSFERQNDGLLYIVSISDLGDTITVHKNYPLIDEDETEHPDLKLLPVTFVGDVGTPTFYAIDSIHLSPQQRLLTFDQNEFSIDYYKIMFNSSGYNAVWFAPPSDNDGTVRLVADFFSVMENDDDVCYWSIVYPNVLIQAVLFAIEVFYRNTSGMNDMLASLTPFLQGIDKDLAEESAIDINEMEG